MLSRVADSLYWMSRYMERADNVARFISVNLHLMLDSNVGEEQQWLPLIHTSGDHEAFFKKHDVASQVNVIHFLAFDESNPNSILSCLRSARENARTIREIITSSMWQQVNEFYLFVLESVSRRESLESLNRFFVQIRRGTATFMGLTDSTLTRGDAWHFSHLGRMLERADKTSRILDVKYFILLKSVSEVGAPIDDIQWGAVLRSASAFEMYRKQYVRVVPVHVVDFLLFDHAFPRSVRYCLASACSSLHAISGTSELQCHNMAERILGLVCSDLVYSKVDHVIESGLHEYIDHLQSKMNEVGKEVFETFFARKIPRNTQSNVFRAKHGSHDVFMGGGSQINLQ
jgi:uncharacterized alpha-E superfamily protein